MLRRHAALITALALIALVTTACIIRTGPSRRSAPAYRTAPPPPQKHKKHSKGRGRDHRLQETPSY